MGTLVADIGDVLLGPWTMILVAAAALGGLAVTLPVAIVKSIDLVEMLVEKSGELLDAIRDHASRARRPAAEHRSEGRSSVTREAG